MNPRYERWRWITFGITWLIYASLYFTRQSFAVAKLAFENDPRITMDRAAYGIVDSTYLTTYMLGQFTFGMLGDRFGPRRLLILGLALSVTAAICSGFSTTLLAFSGFATLQGIAQSMGWPNVNKTMSSWFSLRERGRVLGLWCTHYTAGSAAALPFCGWMMDVYGTRIASGVAGAESMIPYWPAAFWGPAAVVGGVLLLSIPLLRNRPEDIGLPEIEKYHGEPESLLEDESPEAPLPEGSWKLVGEVLLTPSIWMLALSYFSIKLVRYSFIFWGPKYVEESLGSDAYTSTMTAAAMPIGGLIGVIVCGFISDKLFQARRAPVVIISLLLAAIMMLFGLQELPNKWLMGSFFFFIGLFLFGPDSLISSTAAVDFGTKRGAGTATGIVNGIGSIGGILGGYLPGAITTGENWIPLFVVFQVGLLLSAIVLLPLWRSKPPQR